MSGPKGDSAFFFSCMQTIPAKIEGYKKILPKPVTNALERGFYLRDRSCWIAQTLRQGGSGAGCFLFRWLWAGAWPARP